MRAGEQDFFVEQGVDWSRRITLKNQEGRGIDLTGCEILMQVRKSAQLSAVIATPKITITNVSQGEFWIEFDNVQTSSMYSPGQMFKDTATYFYDLVVKHHDGRRVRVLNGKIHVSPEVTKDG